MFKLYNPDEKVILTVQNGSKFFPDSIDNDGDTVIFDPGYINAGDEIKPLRKYKSEERAVEVCDMIVNAFRARKNEFVLPKE